MSIAVEKHGNSLTDTNMQNSCT